MEEKRLGRPPLPEGVKGPYEKTTPKAWRALLAQANPNQKKLDFTQKEFLEISGRKCHYCRRRRAGDIIWLAPEKEWVLANALPCCAICRAARGKLPHRAFIILAKAIATVHGLSGLDSDKEPVTLRKGRESRDPSSVLGPVATPKVIAGRMKAAREFLKEVGQPKTIIIPGKDEEDEDFVFEDDEDDVPETTVERDQ